MSSFEKFISIFEYKIDRPQIFGAYHVICLFLMVALAIFLVWRFRNASDRAVRILLLAVWVTITVLEIIKQVESAFTIDAYGNPIWSYLWHSFPFQFCSTPYYCMPFIIFLPDGFWRRAFIAFFASFSLFAGLVVMIYPGDVFCANLIINIQTMVLHASMVAIGVMLVAYNRKHMGNRYYFGSLSIFYAFAAIAFILNETIYNFVLIDKPSEAINLFYISRYYPCTLPILSNIYASVPYPAYVVIYVLGFTLAAAIFFYSEKGILALIKKIKKH